MNQERVKSILEILIEKKKVTVKDLYPTGSVQSGTAGTDQTDTRRCRVG